MSLQEILAKLEHQNVVLGKARARYLAMEAEKKHFEATLINSYTGKSHAEKTTLAHSTAKWLEFHKRLARKEAVYEFQKLKFEVMNKEYFAIYQQIQIDHGLVKKQT